MKKIENVNDQTDIDTENLHTHIVTDEKHHYDGNVFHDIKQKALVI